MCLATKQQKDHNQTGVCVRFHAYKLPIYATKRVLVCVHATRNIKRIQISLSVVFTDRTLFHPRSVSKFNRTETCAVLHMRRSICSLSSPSSLSPVPNRKLSICYVKNTFIPTQIPARPALQWYLNAKPSHSLQMFNKGWGLSTEIWSAWSETDVASYLRMLV